MGATEAIAEAVKKLSEVGEMLLKPRATRAQGKAEAESRVIVAEAEIAAANLKIQAQRRAELDEIRHYTNLTAALQNAKNQIEFLGARKTLPEKASQEESDPDWFHKWAGYAKETSDVEIRALWAKVLAGEIVQPGKYSLRLLHTINLLRKADAELFSRFCNYVWRNFRGESVMLYNDTSWDLLIKRGVFSERSREQLMELGLLGLDSILGELKATQTEPLCYGGRAYAYMPWNQKIDLPCVLRLTVLGAELLELCDPVPDSEYLVSIGGQCFSLVHPPPSPWPWPDVPQATDN